MNWTEMVGPSTRRITGEWGAKFSLTLLVLAIVLEGVTAQTRPLADFQTVVQAMTEPLNTQVVRPAVNQGASSHDLQNATSRTIEPEPGALIRNINYETPAASQPFPDHATSQYPSTTSYEAPWTYRLQHLNYAEFEAKLTEVWGQRLLATPMDQEQRTLRIFFPEGKTAPEASMVFDRFNGELKYEGSPQRKQAWHLLMQLLDRRESLQHRRTVKVIDIGPFDQSFVRTISFAFQDPQDDSLELPPLTPDALRELQQEIPKLEGRIRIRISSETGTLILEGAPNDIAQMRLFLDRLLRDESIMAKQTASIALNNASASQIAETIQNLYNDQFQNLYEPASVIAVPFNNSLFVAGTRGAIEAIRRIIEGIDGVPLKPEVPPQPLEDYEKGYRTFLLKYISAIDAKLAVDQFFGQSAVTQQAERPSPLPVVTIVEERNNSLTVIGSADLLRRAEALINDLDVSNENKKSKRVGRVFHIRNQIAGDFAVILQDALNGGQQLNIGFTESQLQNFAAQQQQLGQRGQPNQPPQTPITDVQIVDRDGNLSPPANFYDVRITASNASNTIFVVAPEATMSLIAELVQQLDQLPEIQAEVKVFPIVNGDATEVLATLNAIFLGAQQQGLGGLQQGASTANLPLQTPATEGASLINIRFAINERTNTIIASGGSSELELVEALIYRLDEENVQDRVTRVYRLSNASVVDVSAAINNYLDALQGVIDLNPIAGSGPNAIGVNTARRSVIVVEEETSNSVIVNARPEYHPEIEHVIYRLDRRPPMVKVKAMIVQVDLNQLESYGFEFGLQDSSIFEAGLSNTIGTGFVGLDNVSGQILSSLGTGRGQGLTVSAGDESLNFLVRFLKQKGCATVLFSPTVMTLENLQGRFNRGANIQRPSGFNQNVGGVTQAFEDIDIGITIAITPRVSPDRMIIMFVDVENSNLGAEADGTPIGIDQNGNAIISRPINQTIAQTTIMARSGQTVSISGLIQETKDQSVTSVPFLGDLPVVGPLFRSVTNNADRTELLIFLTPYIVDGEDDIAALNEDDFNRMHWCKCDVAEAYGNTSYTGLPYRENAVTTYYPDFDPLGQKPEYKLDQGTSYHELPAHPNSFPRNGFPHQDEESFPADDGWRDRTDRYRSYHPTSDTNGTFNPRQMPSPPDRRDEYYQPIPLSNQLPPQPYYDAAPHHDHYLNYQQQPFPPDYSGHPEGGPAATRQANDFPVRGSRTRKVHPHESPQRHQPKFRLR